jgi:hypothetical protein
MSTWTVIKTEIQGLLDDAVFNTGGSKEANLLTWANRIVREICYSMDIPGHLSTGNLTLTTVLPKVTITATLTDFLRLSRYYTIFRVGDDLVPLVDLPTLFAMNPDHTDTSSGTYPSCVAVEGVILYQYPMTTCTLTVENYLRNPVDIVNVGDSPDLPDGLFVDDLIISGVCGKYGFPYLRESKLALEYYNNSPNTNGQFQYLLNEYQSAYISANRSMWYNRGLYF